MLLEMAARAVAMAAVAQDGEAGEAAGAEAGTETGADAGAETGASSGGSGIPSLNEIIEDPSRVTDLVMAYAPKVALVLVLLFVGFILAGWVGRLTTKALTRGKVEATLAKFFGTMARYGVLILVLLTILQTFGVETTSFAAVIAAAGFAVGLALQGTLSNFSAGVMLLLFRPFKVGHFVKTAGEAGTVDAIDLFTTTLDTPDKRRIIIPNSAIFGSTIENVSHHPIRRVDVNVGADYSADLDKTRAVLMAAMKSIDAGLEDPEPAAVLLELGGSSVDWVCRLWVNADDYWPVKDALTRAVKMHLDEAGIGIPFPQMDLHVNKLEG
ncbi:MAG: mechanosensitive ion channel domain-containing protein [Planctomycetota bacterium]